MITLPERPLFPRPANILLAHLQYASGPAPISHP